MSLKAFHVFFIAISILLAAGVGGWAVLEYRRAGGGDMLAFGGGSWAAAAALAAYLRSFLKKWKRVSYL